MMSEGSQKRVVSFSSAYQIILTSLAFGLVVLIYLVLRVGFLPSGSYWSLDTGYRRIQSDTIRLTKQGVQFDLVYPGHNLDPNFSYIPVNEYFYFIKGKELHLAQWPLLPLLAKPLINLFGDLGGEMIPMLAGLLCVWLTGRLIQRGKFGSAWAGILITGLFTPILIYSLVFWEHTLAVLMGISVLYLLADESPYDHSRIVFGVSGALAGFAGGVRKEMLLFASAVAICLLINLWHKPSAERREAWKKLGIWCFAGAFFVLLYWLTAYLKSGQVIPPEFSISVHPEYTPASFFVTHGWIGVADFIFDEQYGFLSPMLLLAVFAYVWAGHKPTPGRETLQAGLLLVLLIGTFKFLAGYRPAGDGIHGLLSVSPILIVGLNRQAWDSRTGKNLLSIGLLFVAFSILNLGLFTEWGARQGGVEWGTRFMLIFFPLMVPLTIKGWEAIHSRIRDHKNLAVRRAALLHFSMAALLLILSGLMHFLGVMSIHLSLQNNLDLRNKVLALPETYILIEHVWWVPAQAPETYWKKQIFYNNGQPWDKWWAEARPQGITEVAYISLTELDALRLASLAPPGACLRVVDSEWVSGRVFITRLELIEEVPK